MKKQLILSAFVLTSVGAAALGAPRIYAQDAVVEQTIVERIAQRFGANVSDVQKVFDEDREARHAQMQKLFEERLNTLVTEGKITQEQKTKILEKHTEMEATREQLFESMRNKTPEERRALKVSHHDELEQWAQENEIDLSYLMGGFGKGHRKMMKETLAN